MPRGAPEPRPSPDEAIRAAEESIELAITESRMHDDPARHYLLSQIDVVRALAAMRQPLNPPDLDRIGKEWLARAHEVHADMAHRKAHEHWKRDLGILLGSVVLAFLLGSGWTYLWLPHRSITAARIEACDDGITLNAPDESQYCGYLVREAERTPQSEQHPKGK